MKKLVKQFLSFLAVSGIGFLMDFAIYYYLTTYSGLPVSNANMLSAIPAITWVFIFSTRKIFSSNNGWLGLLLKYAVYLSYQAVLLVAISYLAQWLYNFLTPYILHFEVVRTYLSLICKCMITPITMVCNFIVMRFLSEKV